jgi:hypothetical protein
MTRSKQRQHLRPFTRRGETTAQFRSDPDPMAPDPVCHLSGIDSMLSVT